MQEDRVGRKSYPRRHRSFQLLHSQKKRSITDAIISAASNITMASFSPLQFSATARPAPQQSPRSTFSGFPPESGRSFSRVVTVSAVGDVSSNGNIYLFAGAAAAALIGTAFPILFSRKDLCPECDGAGFVRQAGARLRANAARKDLPQIVCPRCNGLGKLGQIDK